MLLLLFVLVLVWKVFLLLLLLLLFELIVLGFLVVLRVLVVIILTILSVMMVEICGDGVCNVGSIGVFLASLIDSFYKHHRFLCSMPCFLYFLLSASIQTDLSRIS